MPKKTPLNSAHRALNARMVEFAGWEMPLHYGSQIEEHRRVRQDAGMFDVSHMGVIDVEGESAAALLSNILTNAIARLKAPGSAFYSLMLNEEGGVVDDLIAYYLAPGRYRLIVNAATTDKDLAWISARSQGFDPPPSVLLRRDLALVAVQGPHARDKVWQAWLPLRAKGEKLERFEAVQIGEAFVSRTGYTGEDGFEILVPGEKAQSLWQALLAQGVAPCGLGARDTLRLEAGMMLYGQDMDESVTPMECGLSWAVDFTGARDFVGKEALLRGRPARRLVGLVLLDKGVLRSHQRVLTPHGEGELTSGGYSPSLERSIGLARVPKEVAPGDSVQVEVRGKMLAARLVKYPFVKEGRLLMEV